MPEESPNSRMIALFVAVFAVVLIARFHPTARGWVADFMRPFTGETQPAADGLLFEQSKVDLILRINEMTNRLYAQEVDLQLLRKVQRENDELRKSLDLPPVPGFDIVPAHVINRDPMSGGRKLRINRGLSSGVAAGQAVLANGHLLGRVAEASKHSALVLTVYDPNCKVSVRIVEKDLHGLMFGTRQSQWNTTGLCTVKYLPRDLQYDAGWQVETSRRGNMLPAGLPVGKLAPDAAGKVWHSMNNLYTTVSVRPAVQGEHYSYVMVLVPKPTPVLQTHEP